jgi:hypothetical membrane protein
MNNFNWYKAFGYGALIWGIASIVLAGLTLTTLSAGWVHGIVAVVFGVSAFLFAIDAKPGHIGQALGYGAIFAAVGLALDGIFMRNFDAHIFSSWQYWLGYALAFFAPSFRSESPETRVLHHT